jgi:V/A-type H+-transporting ATPase subunit F
MRSFLISDNKDTIIGLRLANIQGVLAETKEQIEKHFFQAIKDKEIGIIIITEKVFNQIKEEVLELKKSDDSKLIVTIPDRTGLSDKNFIMKYIKESIGIKI